MGRINPVRRREEHRGSDEQDEFSVAERVGNSKLKEFQRLLK